MTDKKKSTNTAFSQQQCSLISKACEQVQNAININNSTPADPSEDLEEEIKNYFNNGWQIDESLLPTFYNIARHFTDWQKQLMLKGLCYETKVYRDEEGDGIDTPIESWLALENNEITNLPNIGLKDGDKVKVIIVKED